MDHTKKGGAVGVRGRKIEIACADAETSVPRGALDVCLRRIDGREPARRAPGSWRGAGGAHDAGLEIDLVEVRGAK
jgi:hypothetical protein